MELNQATQFTDNFMPKYSPYFLERTKLKVKFVEGTDFKARCFVTNNYEINSSVLEIMYELIENTDELAMCLLHELVHIRLAELDIIRASFDSPFYIAFTKIIERCVHNLTMTILELCPDMKKGV